MIPHFIDLLCRGLSLAALIWGVFSMGFSSAERRAATVRTDQPSPSLRLASRPDNSEADRAHAPHGFDHHG